MDIVHSYSAEFYHIQVSFGSNAKIPLANHLAILTEYKRQDY